MAPSRAIPMMRSLRLRILLAFLLPSGCGDSESSGGPLTGGDADASAGSADGAVELDSGGAGTAVVFDNADGAFEWTPTRYAPCCDTLPEAYFDLTLAAESQTGDASPSGIEFFKSWEEANITPGGFYFRSSGDPNTPPVGLSVAEGEDVVLEGGEVGTYTVVPPLAMNVGDTVGASLTWLDGEHAWENGASGPQTVHLADPGGEYPPDHAAFTSGIIGVRFPLDDGVHYGFVELPGTRRATSASLSTSRSAGAISPSRRRRWSSRRSAEADGAGDAGAADAAVAVRVLVRGTAGGSPRRSRTRAPRAISVVISPWPAVPSALLVGVAGGVGGGALLGAVGVDRRAVLGADVVALAHALGRVVALPEDCGAARS